MEAQTIALPPPRVGAQSTDAELVSAVRRGHDRAFEELFGRYHRRISAYVFGMVKDHARAEDITQDVFMSALRRMRDTDRAIAFKPWIYEIAKNACIDQFRRSRRAEEVSMDAEGGAGLGSADHARLVSGDLQPDARLAAKQDLDHLRGAFGGLSESHHQILVMREFEGLSYREIGERMGMTRPSVESTLFRARKRLAEEYDELVSGERCRRVHEIVEAAASSRLGARDQRRLARHVSHCQPCRRHSALAGLGDLVPERSGVRAKIAALLPLPGVLRDRWLGLGGGGGPAGSSVSSWTATMAPSLDAGWAKAVATAVTVAVAGVGVGAVSSSVPSQALTPPPGAASLIAAHEAAAPRHATSRRAAGTAPVPAPRASRSDPAKGVTDLVVTKTAGTSSAPVSLSSGTVPAGGVPGGGPAANAGPLGDQPLPPGTAQVPGDGAGATAGVTAPLQSASKPVTHVATSVTSTGLPIRAPSVGEPGRTAGQAVDGVQQTVQTAGDVLKATTGSLLGSHDSTLDGG